MDIFIHRLFGSKMFVSRPFRNKSPWLKLQDNKDYVNNESKTCMIYKTEYYNFFIENVD